MSKKLLVILASVLVVIIGATTAVIAVSNTPSNVAASAVADFTEDIFERDEIAPLIKTLKKGSVELSLTGIKVDGEDSFKNSHVKGKVYFSEDAIFLSDIDIKADKNSIVGDLYLSKDSVYINEEKILKGAYGFEYSDGEDELNDSVFSPDSRSDYALDKSSFEEIVSIVNYLEKFDDISKDFKKVAKKVVKKLWNIVIDNADVSSKNTDMRINGDKNKVRLIEISVDSNAAENIILDTVEYLRDSKEVKNFLDKYDDVLSPIISDLYGEDFDSISEMYEDLFNDNEEYIDDLCDELSEYFQTLTLKIATPKSSTKLLKLELDYGKETWISLECGAKGIKNTDKIALTFGGVEVSYEVKSNDKKKFDAICNVSVGDEEYEISATIDKANEKYKVTYKEVDEWYSYYYGECTYTDEYKISGKFSQKGNKTTLTVDTVKNTYVWKSEDYPWENEEYEDKTELKCEVVISTKDKMPSRKKDFGKISDITEKDLDDWVEKFEDFDIS